MPRRDFPQLFKIVIDAVDPEIGYPEQHPIKNSELKQKLTEYLDENWGLVVRSISVESSEGGPEDLAKLDANEADS